jgi:hypothetical protein
VTARRREAAEYASAEHDALLAGGIHAKEGVVRFLPGGLLLFRAAVYDYEPTICYPQAVVDAIQLEAAQMQRAERHEAMEAKDALVVARETLTRHEIARDNALARLSLLEARLTKAEATAAQLVADALNRASTTTAKRSKKPTKRGGSHVG